MNITPMTFLQLIQGGQNPQQLTLQLLRNELGGTPVGDNLINLANNNQQGAIEDFARNLFKQQGRNFDEEFNQFKEMMGFK